MASQTLDKVNDRWADGVTVSVFLQDTFGKATGSAVTTGVVVTGSVTFTGLADGTGYVASANGKSSRFRTSTPDTAGSGSGGVLGYTSGTGWDARPSTTKPVVWATNDTAPSPALPTDKQPGDVVIKP